MVGLSDISQQLWFFDGTSTTFSYSPVDDGWNRGTASNVSSLGGGSCGCTTNVGPSGTCFADGTSTTLVTSENLKRNLKGYKILITGGPAAGDVRTIASNVVGVNGAITVTSAFSANPTTATTYRLMTPKIWVAAGNTITGNASFRQYDWATDTWSNGGNLPVGASTDARLEPTPSFMYNEFVSFATGTATAGGANTLTNSGKTWATNQWTRSQIRITGGTGAGQIRTISSNTATQITVSANWTTNPDATSTYSIEGNDDFLYWSRSGSTAFYRYQISTATWTQIGTRGGAPSGSVQLNWVWEVEDPTWTNENAIGNGRYLFSWRSSTVIMDRYDIATDTWSTPTFSPTPTSIISGSFNSTCDRNSIYLQDNSNAGRMYRYDVLTSEIGPSFNIPITPTSSTHGNKMTVMRYKDGATIIRWIYVVPQGTTTLARRMIIS
jgi:hypothetical protein